jgi:small neutral amino acid transporter SnatA (MarC family)
MRVAILPLIFWAAALGVVRLALLPAEHCGSDDPDAMRAAAQQAGGWLAVGQQLDGSYTYDYDQARGRPSGDYNIVRHAGVTMSLYQIAHRLGDQQAFATAERGTAWMLGHLVRVDDWAALVDEGAIDARLGATALMTIALAERRLMTGDPQHDATLRELGRFMLALQRPDGGFSVAWEFPRNGPNPTGTSVYYPGEALWALAMLHEAFPSDEFDAGAWQAVDFITLRRDEVEGVKFPPLNDHWAAYGMAEMSDWDRPLSDHHIAYARRLAGRFSLLVRTEAQKYHDDPLSFIRGGVQAGASLGTWIEGLAALWRLAVSDQRLTDLRDEIRERAACGAGHLVERQELPAAGPELAGAWFVAGRTRMDDQQHAASALLYTSDALEERGAGEAGAPATESAEGVFVETLLRFLVIFNPPGAALAFHWLGAQHEPPTRRRAQLAACCIAAALTLAAGLLGNKIVALFGVTLPSFQIAAGVLLLVSAVGRLLVRDPFAIEPFSLGRWTAAISALRAALAVVTPAAFAALVFYGASAADDGKQSGLGVVAGLSVALAFTLSVALLMSARNDRPVQTSASPTLGASGSQSVHNASRSHFFLRELGRVLLVVLVVLAVGVVVDGVEAV